jgi:hypothetical protein
VMCMFGVLCIVVIPLHVFLLYDPLGTHTHIPSSSNLVIPCGPRTARPSSRHPASPASSRRSVGLSLSECDAQAK